MISMLGGEAGRVAPVEVKNEREMDHFMALKTTEKIRRRKNKLENKIQKENETEQNYDGSSHANRVNSNGRPSGKDCSKSSEPISQCSAALGGSRIKLRPQWPGELQRRPRTQVSSIHFSRKVIA